MTEAQELLQNIFTTLSRTGSALARLRAQLAPLVPFTADKLRGLDEATINATDALLKRFEQHVDALRAAARTIIRIEGEQDRYRTARQVFDRLASLAVVDDVARVMDLIELRNRTAHAYASDSDRQARILNAVFDSVPELLTLAGRLARFARTEKLLPDGKDALLAELEERARVTEAPARIWPA